MIVVLKRLEWRRGRERTIGLDRVTLISFSPSSILGRQHPWVEAIAPMVAGLRFVVQRTGSSLHRTNGCVSRQTMVVVGRLELPGLYCSLGQERAYPVGDELTPAPYPTTANSSTRSISNETAMIAPIVNCTQP